MRVRSWRFTGSVVAIAACGLSCRVVAAQSAPSSVEVYVAAYRRLARQTCRAGARDALAESLADMRGTMDSLSRAERTLIDAALDSARARLLQAGGCPALVAPTRRVLIDSFEGHAWGSPLSETGSAHDAHADANGFMVLTHHTKYAGVKGNAIFTYTGGREDRRLLNGRYELPVKDKDCGKRWRAVEQEMTGSHPSLRVSGGDALALANARCDADTRAVTTLRNPDTGAIEARMTLSRDRKGKPVIEVEFPGLTMR